MILIIPDVHGRDFWKIPCQNIDSFEKVIFLGDYLDPYSGEATNQEALEIFKEIIKLKKKYPEKVILLIGNHDCPYAFDEYGEALDYWCRHDYDNHDYISKLFKDNIEFFKLAWEYPSEKYGKVLFTHAGVTNELKDICGLSADEINEFYLKKNTKGIPNVVGLAMVSFYRGGYDISGSPVWADVREHMKNQVPQVFQIFGHTYAKKELIMEHFAMLDLGNTCWILDNDEIFKYGDRISRDS